MRNSQDYILQSGDLLEIQVFMEPSMDRTLRISGNGTITFPLVGNINLKGLSVAKAEEDMVFSLKNYIKSPQVSILIKEYGNKTVHVLGQVSKPQAIEIPPEKPLTVLEAITSAGGFTDIAAPSKVRVLRVENNKQKNIDVDVAQITKMGNKSLDITLMPGDVVFVPQSMF
ncbi:polysaccharide export outer membrane protein [Elusimicrobium posterum]|uniref:polysaccharide biosynthesis/export family protein n=1 Tax=Elusimicrobium posterum TaxID=3116653 RepID=UPI003C73AF7E